MRPGFNEKEGRRAGSEEFDLALDRAEQLLRQTDRTRERARLLRVLQLVTLALAILTLTAVITIGKGGIVVALAVIVTCLVVASVVVLGIQIVLLAPLQRQLGRDEKTMIEIVDMLRELLRSVSEEDNWSHSRYRVARERIARFPIGPKGMW